MKTRINLFRKKARRDYLSSHADKIKKILNVLGVGFFLLFILLIAQVIKLNTKQQVLFQKKSLYLKYLLEEKESEVNVRYFKSKQTQMNSFLKNDAHFLPYYTVLKKSLDDATIPPLLDTIDIDKDRNTRFIVKFNSYDEMLFFLKYVEDEIFLQHFNSLTLQTFTIDKQTIRGNRFELELKGQFKELL